MPGDMISPGVQSTNMGRNESTPDLRDARYAEVAAIQNSLAHMTMPHHSDLGAYGHGAHPSNRGQRSPLLSPSGKQPLHNPKLFSRDLCGTVSISLPNCSRVPRAALQHQASVVLGGAWYGFSPENLLCCAVWAAGRLKGC